MDLNRLLHRHQVSLMLADSATTPDEKRAHDQFADDYAARIRSARIEMGATGGLDTSGHSASQSADTEMASSDRRTRQSRTAVGRVVLTPRDDMPYKVVLTDAVESTESAFATMQECEAFIRDNTPAPAERCTLYDREAPDRSDSAKDSQQN